MARGKTLEALLVELRAEIGQSTNTSVSRASVDMLTTALRRTQERLWEDNDWAHLKVDRDIEMEAGERYYDFPNDLDLTRIEKVEIKYGGIWQPVNFGITTDLMTIHDSDLDVRNDPVARWDYYNGTESSQVEQFQVWPIPANNADTDTKELVMRLRGIRSLNPLVAMSDTADLDDRLLVLYSSAGLLAKLKSPDASSKLDEANLLYARIKGRRGGLSQPFKIGGNNEEKKESGLRLRVAYADQNGNIFN